MSSRSLADVRPGTRVRVAEVALDPGVTRWLACVGIAKGDALIVLRRASFGGPLHLRRAGGGELAIARDVAACVNVDVEPA